MTTPTHPERSPDLEFAINELLYGPDPEGVLADIDAAMGDDDLPDIELDAAVSELLRRQRAQRSLAEYARAIEIPGAPATDDVEAEQFKPIESSLAKHHLLFLNKAQECIEKKNGRLMVFCPPGSAKSTYLSVVTPSWCMAKWPQYRVIIASYASDIAEKHSRKARNVCRQEQHVSIWPDRPELRADQRAVGEWALSNGSEFMAAGLQAGITGNRADLLIIDDPVKNREDADSETIQKKTSEEFRDSATSRLKPGASIILIQTRWNENDLAGSLLPEDYDGRSGPVLCRDGQVWEIVNLPAECERTDDPLGREPGEYLWTEWFDAEHWNIRKNDPQGQRTWNSLYQQRPTAQEGIEFKREWFRRYDPALPRGYAPTVNFETNVQITSSNMIRGLPKELTIYAASDFATKEDKGDFTEHGIWAIDPEHNLWVLDWWFGQKTSDVYIAAMIAMIRRWKPRKWWHEGGPIGEAIAPAIIKSMRESKCYTVLEAKPSIRNKAIKLSSFQARAANRTVYFPANAAWADRVITQLCSFPAGRYDDAADVCGLAGRGIDDMANPYVSSVERKPQLVPFTAQWLEHVETNESNRPRYF